jgi:hypothetical protein
VCVFFKWVYANIVRYAGTLYVETGDS